jgi:hypothetical protein
MDNGRVEIEEIESQRWGPGGGGLDGGGGGRTAGGGGRQEVLLCNLSELSDSCCWLYWLAIV